jgi:hypothetical protein
MKNIVIVFLTGLVVIAVAAGAFYHYVGMNHPLSPDGSDWSDFGSYFGGVVGPVFSFLSIILLVYTIIQQSKNIELATSEALKLDMLRYVSRADEEIDNWLKTEVAASHSSQTAVKLGLIVWGVVKPNYVNSSELNPCLERLLKLTCSYTSAIALYEDNVDPYFIYKHHCTKAEDLIEFLESHVQDLGQMAGHSLGLCRHQLEKDNYT